MKIIKLAADIPDGYGITRDTPYIFQHRLTDTETVSRRTGRRSNKEYIVRVYHYPDAGTYGVIAFYGRIGGTLSRDWKGQSARRETALAFARRIIREKAEDASKHYIDANTGVVRESLLWRVPGRDAREVTVQSTTPAQNVPRSVQPDINVPSIRLPPERIPTANTEYINSRRVIEIPPRPFHREFVIRVYAYRDGWYSTVEWYSPDGREYRIHPKLLTQDRSDAIAMWQRLIDIKEQRGYRGIADNQAAPGRLMEETGGAATEEPSASQEPSTSQSLSEMAIADFAASLRSQDRATMGAYNYRLYRVNRNNMMAYDIIEYREQIADPLRTRTLLDRAGHDRREEAIRILTEWAIERRIEQLAKLPERPSKDITTPAYELKETEGTLSEDEKDFYELLGKKIQPFYKTANDWYLNMGESAGKDLRGYFKFIVRTDKDPIYVYNIWWEGLDNDVRIAKHDMSSDEFETYKEEIINVAKEESLKAYKEVMSSYAGR